MLYLSGEIYAMLTKFLLKDFTCLFLCALIQEHRDHGKYNRICQFQQVLLNEEVSESCWGLGCLFCSQCGVTEGPFSGSVEILLS